MTSAKPRDQLQLSSLDPNEVSVILVEEPQITQRYVKALQEQTQKFFGLQSNETTRQHWHDRRSRLASRRHHGLLSSDAVDASDADNKAPKPSVLQYFHLCRKAWSHRNECKDVVDRGRDHRVYGIGEVGKILSREFRHSVRHNQYLRNQLENMDDYRPYFTYWITFMQIALLIMVCATYGFGSFGMGVVQSSGPVLTSKMIFEHVDVFRPTNFWVGPDPAVLIRVGAKFAPCMRRDASIETEIEQSLNKEANETGCCVRNDHTGCVQTVQKECSPLLSTWYKWGNTSRLHSRHRKNGPVCGIDPYYCASPSSRAPYEWPDDLRQWPICHKQIESTIVSNSGIHISSDVPKYVTCEVLARPCCVGIHGKCQLRTAQYCAWVGGTYHPEANLCSQVNCMHDVCGMLPFAWSNYPDQIYRLWISLFLHAGFVHLLLSVIFQLWLMRDLEKMCGSFRLAIIYFGSGVVGNLVSAIFVPYRAESGPAGSHFGIIGAFLIELINVWSLLRHPWTALGKLSFICCLLLIVGLLPWVDNFAHIFGFISGVILSFAILPYVSLGHRDLGTDDTVRCRFIIASLIGFAIFVIFLFLVFYIFPFTDCRICRLFTCVPFTESLCADQNINYRKHSNSLPGV